VRWGIPERSPIPTSPSQRCALGPSLSPLKGGEGFTLAAEARIPKAGEGMLRLIQFAENGFEDSGKVVDYVTVPEADYPIAITREFCSAPCVRFFPLRVLAAVKFDGDLVCRACEIDNIPPNRVLSAKAMPGAETAQSIPEPFLNLRRAAPQTASDTRLRPKHR
jgi:hypothetical protein